MPCTSRTLNKSRIRTVNAKYDNRPSIPGNDAGSPNGSPSQGNYYFGGVGTLTTCRGSITQAPIMFYAHVTAQPSISSITQSTIPVGLATHLQIQGANFGDSGTVQFTPESTGTSFSGTYTAVAGSNGAQATITVTPQADDTYTVSLQETQDIDGFNFQSTAAKGQPPASKNTASLTVTGPPVYTVAMREFIRANWIQGPLTCNDAYTGYAYPVYFHGDSRNFDSNPQQETPPSNPFRATQVAVVQPEAASSPSGVGGPFLFQSGTTRQYDSASLIPGNDPAGSGYILNPSIPDSVAAYCNGSAQITGIATATPPSPPLSRDLTSTLFR
jgi:hypothetical protein